MLSVKYGLKANFPVSPDDDALYFCTDTREFFKGANLYTEPVRFLSGTTLPTAKAQGVLYVLSDGSIKVWDGTAEQVIALATTDYTTDGVLASTDTDSTLPTSKRVYESIKNLAPKASPTFTGTVTVPTATAGDSSTAAASTAFVAGEISSALASIAGALHFKGVKPTVADLPATGNTEGDVWQVTTNPQGTDAEYVWTLNAGTAGGEWTELGAVIDLSAYATLASPALTGTPTAPTAAAGTNTTQIATTAFVAGEIATAGGNYDAAGSAAAAQTAAEAYTDTCLTWGTF